MVAWSNLTILDQGIAYTFGRNEKGQLGDGSLKSRSNPYPVDINDETFVKAAVGRNHTILIATSGKVYAAGDNKLKQLGLTETKDHKTFTLVPFTDEIFVDVACGADFTIAITSNVMIYFINIMICRWRGTFLLGKSSIWATWRWSRSWIHWF